MATEGVIIMAHKHSIYDTDSHFKIDQITRMIKNESSSKVTLIQGDHNSERFTFEMPRYIEGHDMSLCNVSRVHYLNGEQVGLYEIDDLQLSPNDEEVVICSWLISCNATGISAPLAFLLEFSCITDGVVDYRWNTAIYSGISIGKGMNNGDVIAYEYPDIFEMWKQSIEYKGYQTEEQVRAIVDEIINEALSEEV